MKKTLIAFSVTVMLSIILFLTIGLTGCEWFNTSVLGKPNKTELEAKEKAARDEAVRDSTRKAEQAKYDALLAKEKEEAAKKVSLPFNIIVGAFEEFPNADNMVSFYQSKGFNPQTFDFGGLRHVSAVSFETMVEAERALENLLETDYCEEAWIFKR